MNLNNKKNTKNKNKNLFSIRKSVFGFILRIKIWARFPLPLHKHPLLLYVMVFVSFGFGVSFSSIKKKTGKEKETPCWPKAKDIFRRPSSWPSGFTILSRPSSSSRLGHCWACLLVDCYRDLVDIPAPIHQAPDRCHHFTTDEKGRIYI
jgi:hypothetical protein